MEWTVSQILATNDRMRVLIDERPRRFNPKPRGVIREGSATEAALTYMRKAKCASYTFQQLMVGTGRSHQALCWALIYLRELGHIRAKGDFTRNSRYLRYELIESKQKDHGDK